MNTLKQYAITPMTEAGPQQSVRQAFNIPEGISLADIPPQHMLITGERLVKMRSSSRRIEHIRHLYKYLDMPLPRHKRFYFWDDNGYIGLEAASLFEFKEILATLPLSSLLYHQRRGDFATWVRTSLGDVTLAIQIDKLSRRTWDDDSLRDVLLRRVSARYQEICTIS
jgi:hypothetical protein